MKLLVTRKAMRGQNCYRVGYCQLQNLLASEEPFAYSARAEGWACDYYEIDNGITISTGYAPIGKDTDHDIVKQYDDKAAKIWCNRKLSYDQQVKKIKKLLKQFAEELSGSNND